MAILAFSNPENSHFGCEWQSGLRITIEGVIGGENGDSRTFGDISGNYTNPR
jgi:hypothetical protein